MLDKERITNLVQDEKFISGIYNYCDRWCERCPQTSRCLNYQIGEEEFSDPETRDINNETFWKKMSELMQTTLEMLKDMMVSAGIDLEQLDNDEYMEEERAFEEAALNHVVCKMAKDYIDMVQEWIDEVKDLFSGTEYQISEKDESSPEPNSLIDAMDVLQWYQHQIFVKLMRAVSGSIEESEFDEDDHYAKDSDGSAKVALIGIDRSIAAWGNINIMLPGFYLTNVKNILIHLDQLKRKIEKTFPNARKFIRPGFDNIDLNG